MSTTSKTTKKLTLIPLVLMIFTSVYGFNNIPRSFYKMGYAAIPWYILSGITFFVPFALMVAEFGSAFKEEKGGIYSWMEKSIGPRFAFIGTFMWYFSYITWMVNVASGMWVPVSNAIFGKDTTQTWTLFGFQGPQVLGIFGILWILLVTYTSTKGLDKIKKVTSLGGTAVLLLNVFLWIGAIAVFLGNSGSLAEPIVGIKSFTQTPNPKYAGNIIASLAFVVYALFAYGGIEAVGGLVDETENPEKTFPKGILISAAIISVGYSLGILLIGIFTNWADVMGIKDVNLGNASYIVMSNLGYSLGTAFGASEATATALGHGVARFVGLSMFLALSGAFFTLMYSPLKQIIEGTPTKLWPGKVGETKNGLPINAMWIQATIVCVMIALVAFGGSSMATFFNILVSMTNVAMTLPYLFITLAFPYFKKKTEIKKPFIVFKSHGSAIFWTWIVILTVGLANLFSIIQPAIEGDMQTTIWSIAGPIIFSVIAWLMYNSYEKKIK
ncbi:glutamate/gamma-aminobutyrate family transporter YjeM [Clostridium saccharobutylicum]|uniref:Inner membrane transporter YjeM n=1 Tax=Clostridium saccharobutylicum DSM 13864 TaxID=1345695 RepID=U5MQK7_CLOSA|nr:glutamate/gamma-aminobutyrate family transporter YjeM [Clostridium saccharobutylicum]AGX42808.1 inner membrane transporter YjeM [Clostridium saccharobutylicum DSM 13864]AQR90105.1 inner membrane transporter YjeM [Clostridium saccharobutylicum]AQS00011.1 inner membrane transporter YjeM [Clostridium saccharobutylicum]AQS09796.1 inner membrane transporter YjeM [Clostridium saccharobutylicum]AQS13994.1 inner membrane transporter YjeM [Clostridium saccharobutylicum]